MEIYVVQPGDDINSIAGKYGMSAAKLIQDNGLENPDDLVTGQTIVIVFPAQTHTVKEGDTLSSIAQAYGVTVMQLLRNNPFLSERKYIYPGEVLTVSYITSGNITTNGYAYPYMAKKVLLKTLPNLTYLSIYNYSFTVEGDIITFFDDSDIIQTSRDYGTIPLMLISSLSAKGESNTEAAYELLINEEVQDRHINNILTILQSKGYGGVNLTFNYVNETTKELYEKYLKKVCERLKDYIVIVTVNPLAGGQEAQFAQIDYSEYSQAADVIMFMHYIWGTNYGPPAPVCSYSDMQVFLKFIVTVLPPDIIEIGIPVIGYDWELPYIAGRSSAYSLSLNAAINIAMENNSEIQFDDASRTPYFKYEQINLGTPTQHIVWFMDARSMFNLVNCKTLYGLSGVGIWNVMIFYPQFWLIVNSQYDVEKLIHSVIK